MTLTVSHGELVTVLRRTVTGQDSYGNDTVTWTEEDVAGVPVWPGDANAAGGNERVQARDMVLTGMTVGLPYGFAITAYDRIRVRGAVYEVNGEPASWRSPLTGTEAGVIVSLTLVQG